MNFQEQERIHEVTRKVTKGLVLISVFRGSFLPGIQNIPLIRRLVADY